MPPQPKQPDKRPWKGRFSENTEPLIAEFTESVSFDQRLYSQDIEGSLAHARMLKRAGILSDSEYSSIDSALTEIRTEIERGEFVWDPDLEDVHMNIEAALTAKIGNSGKKLHTARSRNDQVATDLRLFTRDCCDELDTLLLNLLQNLTGLAEQECETIMPGFTHMQVAQPISFGHHMMAWYEMLKRDRQRFQECRARLNVSPLGAAALAGTPHPIDPEYSATELNFAAAFDNSLDAVSDRDFAIEFCFCCALLMVHLSRIAEELILWNSQQFNFISLPDRFCTGSSIMPQKKNPDFAELIRGRSARTQGNLVSLLSLMKGQPLAYNRDNQEDKEPLFHSADTVRDSVALLAALIPDIQVNRPALQTAVQQGYATATDLADYLVGIGVPFREAHEITGKIVAEALSRNIGLTEMQPAEMRVYCSDIGDDIVDVLTPENSLRAKNHRGGTAPEQVLGAVAKARQELAAPE